MSVQLEQLPPPPDASDLTDLVSVRWCADYARCSPDKVLRWIHKDGLAAVDIGDGARACLRVPRTAFLEFLRRRVVRSAASIKQQVSEARRPRGPRSRYLEQRHSKQGAP